MALIGNGGAFLIQRTKIKIANVYYSIFYGYGQGVCSDEIEEGKFD